MEPLQRHECMEVPAWRRWLIFNPQRKQRRFTYKQLERRPKNLSQFAEAWLPYPQEFTVHQLTGPVIMQNYRWPNCLFLPEDATELLFYELPESVFFGPDTDQAIEDLYDALDIDCRLNIPESCETYLDLLRWAAAKSPTCIA